MRVESGDQEKAPAPALASVSFSASPPDAEIRYSCALGPSAPAATSPRVDRNATHCPSGDHRGLLSSGPPVNLRDFPPDAATIQISTCSLLSLRSARATV